jgi:hypothetical protein
VSPNSSKRFELDVSHEGDTAYLRLPTHPGKGKKGVTAQQVDLMSDFKLGKDVRVLIDLGRDGEIIGVEILLYD